MDRSNEELIKTKKCLDCTKCKYQYCINENYDLPEPADRSQYFKDYFLRNKEQINQKHRDAYKLKKQQGICVRCEKKATNGLYCLDHYIQQKRRSIDRCKDRKAKRHERGLIPSIRKTQGLCLWCGEKATGNTLACDKHRKIFMEAAKQNQKEIDI